MNRFLLVLALVFVFASAKAHNPNTTSVIVSPINGVWVAQFTISQEGANVALNQFYKNKALQNLSPKEYKTLYIKYVKAHFHLLVDDKAIPLSSGGIKLGSHQTDIKFLLPDFPINYTDIRLKLNLFKENEGQNTVIKFIEQDKSFRKVLNHKNNFSLKFKNTKNTFVAKTDETQSNLIYYFLIFGALSLGTIAYLKKKIQVK